MDRSSEKRTISGGLLTPCPSFLNAPLRIPGIIAQLSHFTEVNTEAQSGQRACSRSQSKSVAEWQVLRRQESRLPPTVYPAGGETPPQRPPGGVQSGRQAGGGGAYARPSSSAEFGGEAFLQPSPLQHGYTAVQHLGGGAAAARGPRAPRRGRCGCGCGAVRAGPGWGGVCGACRGMGRDSGLGSMG